MTPSKERLKGELKAYEHCYRILKQFEFSDDALEYILKEIKDRKQPEAAKPEEGDV